MDFPFPIWDQLTPGQQRALSAGAVRRRAAKGTVLSGGSDSCLGLLVVQSGQLRVYSLSAEGKEITLYRLLPRDVCLFSAACILSGISFALTMAAEKDTEFWLIPAEVYKGVMAESAPLANYTNAVMASRFSELMFLLEQVMWTRLDRRLAAFLLEEAALEGSPRLSLTHEAIGNHLGTAREVITRMLRYFQQEGMVALSRGTVELTNRDKLARLAQEITPTGG